MAARKTDVLSAVRAYYSRMSDELNGKRLCVCLSGGADSVALLRASLALAGEFGYELCACHFNHMIRGLESDRDEKFCIDLCEKLGVTLYRGRDDVPAYAKKFKKSTEEAARECRYAFFERCLNNRRFDFYATAHNLNDDSETLLLNLIRGSGSNGGSSLASRNGALLRPLLCAGREEIEKYLESVSQDHIHDSTNDSLDYTRNYVRKKLIPALEKINPNVSEALAGFAESARTDRLFFDSLTELHLNDDLSELPKALTDRIILRKYKDFSGKILNSEQLNIISASTYCKTRRVLKVDNNYECVTDNGSVEFLNIHEIIPKYPVQTLDQGENYVFGERITVFISENNDLKERFNNLSTKQPLSFDNIIGRIFVRQRETGDKIRIFGINRSVKKLFIEKKIPKELRDLIPVFCDSEGIVYIPFVGVADRAFPKNANRVVTVKTVFNTIEKERWSMIDEK